MATMVVAGRLPALLALWYVAASLLAMLVYRLDKSAAQRGRQRTPETTLHLIALLGGWPGALLAQALFRHKSSKAAFQLRFWITVVANVAALYWACRQPALMAALDALPD
ncbi:DNA-binding protein [Xanthomonas arboricola]|nr:DNA-binding protein [Xanthomonas arboricola]